MVTKPTPTKTAAAARKVASNSDTQRAEAERVAARAAYFESLVSDTPSRARQLVASIGQLVSFATTFYWGLQAVGWLSAAALMFTGSAFITFCTVFIGALLAFRASWHAGTAAFAFVVEFDGDTINSVGRDLRIAAAKKTSLVKSWFQRSDRIDVAAA
jgi:hypothetical protein